MILVDISSIIHRMIYTSIKNVKPQKIDGVYNTPEFINYCAHLIMRELFDIYIQFSSEYGEMHICVDNSTNEGYWRRDILSTYKSSRKLVREKSEIDFCEVFLKINELIEEINLNLPWKVLSVPRAEADDIMLVLAKVYADEKVLIHSPDKDMIQAQRHPNVFQYSSITRKWLTPEHKSDDMEMWIKEHCVLGDISDGIPKITDGTEFSDIFIEYLQKNNYNVTTPLEFRLLDIPAKEKIELIENYDVYKFNRKGENTGIKDVYKRTPFGPSALKKAIKTHGNIDNWLDSHPLYRSNYERNYNLIMEEGIPEYIRNGIIDCLKTAPTDYNMVEFEKYLKTNGLNSLVMELPSIFKNNRKLCAADFDW